MSNPAMRETPNFYLLAALRSTLDVERWMLDVQFFLFMPQAVQCGHALCPPQTDLFDVF
jgi:hypothetical protein